MRESFFPGARAGLASAAAGAQQLQGLATPREAYSGAMTNRTHAAAAAAALSAQPTQQVQQQHTWRRSLAPLTSPAPGVRVQARAGMGGA